MKAHEAKQLAIKTNPGQYGEIIAKITEAAGKGERKMAIEKIDPDVRERLIAAGYTFNLIAESKGEPIEISW